jgi:hypothetical protein
MRYVIITNVTDEAELLQTKLGSVHNSHRKLLFEFTTLNTRLEILEMSIAIIKLKE